MLYTNRTESPPILHSPPAEFLLSKVSPQPVLIVPSRFNTTNVFSTFPQPAQASGPAAQSRHVTRTPQKTIGTALNALSNRAQGQTPSPQPPAGPGAGGKNPLGGLQFRRAMSLASRSSSNPGEATHSGGQGRSPIDHKALVKRSLGLGLKRCESDVPRGRSLPGERLGVTVNVGAAEPEGMGMSLLGSLVSTTGMSPSPTPGASSPSPPQCQQTPPRALLNPLTRSTSQNSMMASGRTSPSPTRLGGPGGALLKKTPSFRESIKWEESPVYPVPGAADLYW